MDRGQPALCLSFCPGVTASFTTAGAEGVNSATISANDTGIMLTNTNTSVTIAQGTTALSDSTTAGTTTINASTKGIETISYQRGTNESTTNLSTTDLLTAGDAQTALTQINAAINNVSAQRGYLGAQVNTLNAVSQVETTQQQNILAAQNSVQATDYAQATSNLSKYEVLSQTGISALAQANSLQQEVTKLLQ